MLHFTIHVKKGILIVAQTQKPIRWWPLSVILSLALLGIIVIWILEAGHRQDKVVWTTMVVILTALLGTLWLLCFSRLRWRIRLLAVTIVLLCVVLSTNLFQFKGFSGDLTPIFEWRWQEKPTTFRQDSSSPSNIEKSAMDSPQFLGQHRNGIVSGIQLNLNWDTHPPKLVWRHPVGAGWSGFAVVGDSAITQEQEGDWEKVVCYELHIADDKLLVSTGYGVGAKLYHISRNPAGEFNVSVVWETIYLKAKFTNIVYYKGYLYGLDDGIFACINPADGTRQWKRGRYGHGQTLLVSDVLLVLTESGEVVLVEPDPEGHREHARFTALKGKTWNTPALAGRYLLVRNDREAACYELPVINTK
jgi:hypothetical protein